MNYDHLKETKTTIRSGRLYFSDPSDNSEGYVYTPFVIGYTGNTNRGAYLTFEYPEQGRPINFSKKELLTMSSFLKDIAETL
jgi:hypothetical protein